MYILMYNDGIMCNHFALLEKWKKIINFMN